MVLCNKIAEGLDTRYIGESSVIEFLLGQVLMGVPTNYVSLRSSCRFERIFYNKVAGWRL
ncbi:hypothetical protein [Leptospira santarosai]|uniref:hypothetical protein n=1 Tax=Leptospira santarosai TaxID=28183 RepID=UPI0024AFA252|nr:hypothetical protein [Leptospira santarosai]MDI7166888.1 hypothetical protein [Leptospira santarosai]